MLARDFKEFIGDFSVKNYQGHTVRHNIGEVLVGLDLDNEIDEQDVFRMIKTWVKDFKSAKRKLAKLLPTYLEENSLRKIVTEFEGFNEHINIDEDEYILCDFNYGTICATIKIANKDIFIMPNQVDCYLDGQLRDLGVKYELSSDVIVSGMDMVLLDNSFEEYCSSKQHPRYMKCTVDGVIDMFQRIKKVYGGDKTVTLNALNESLYGIQTICIDDSTGVDESNVLIEFDHTSPVENTSTVKVYSQSGLFELKD